jgi:1-acyl-sn-glycerol-3-phosphate acyltransferase
MPYQLRIIAKASLGSFPFLGWHLRRTGHLLVDRRNPDRAGIPPVARPCTSGLSLIIFPRTRSADGTVGRFKAGRSWAIEAGLPPRRSSDVARDAAGFHRARGRDAGDPPAD